MRLTSSFRAMIMAATILLAVPAGATIVWEYAGTAVAGGIPGLAAGDPFTITVSVDETTPDSEASPDLGMYPGAVQSVVFDFGAGTGSFAGAPPGSNHVMVSLPGTTYFEVGIDGIVPLAGHPVVDVRILLVDPLTLGGAATALGGDAFPNPFPPFDASLPFASNVWAAGELIFLDGLNFQTVGTLTSASQVPEAATTLLLGFGALIVSGLRQRSAA